MEIVLLVFTTYFVTAFWNCCQAETSSNGIADSSVKNNVETRMRELESQVDRLKREIQTMRNTDSIQRVKRATKSQIILTESPAREVGFHVKLEATTKIIKDQTLKFDQAVTRIGNAYDLNTGVFTCIQPGTYAFSMNIVADMYHYVEAAIMKNQISISNAVSDNHAGGAWTQGSGSAIVQLKRGDKVYVSIVWLGNGLEGNVYGNGLSSFSGYLLRDSNY